MPGLVDPGHEVANEYGQKVEHAPIGPPADDARAGSERRGALRAPRLEHDRHPAEQEDSGAVGRVEPRMGTNRRAWPERKCRQRVMGSQARSDDAQTCSQHLASRSVSRLWQEGRRSSRAGTSSWSTRPARMRTRSSPASSSARSRPSRTAFVQTLDGRPGAATYHRYPFDGIQRRRRIDSTFGSVRTASPANPISLDHGLARTATMRGELRFSGGQGWPVTACLAGHHGLVRVRALHGVLPRRAELRPSHRGRADGGRRERLTSPAAAGTLKRTGDSRFPGHGSGCRATTSPPLAPASPPRLRSFRGWAARSTASSSGCGTKARLYRFATYTGAGLSDRR